MTERVHRVQRVQATPRRIVVPPEQVPADPLALTQQALQRFTARPRTLQRQAVLPVLRAAAMDRQEQTRLRQQQTQVQRQITALGEVTPVPRPAEPLTVPAKPITPGDWVTVMRLRAEEVAGRPLDARSSSQFTALQRQVAQTLAQGFRADRGDAQARYATYGEHLATLQRHAVSAPVSRVVLGLIPSAERLPLQRATDEALQRFQAQDQAALSCESLQSLQRQLAELDAEATQPVLARIQARRGRGNPLPETLQRHLEQGLNHDLSRVRIHDDAEADKLAKGVNAIAFTTGTDIFFRSGRFNPNTQTGLELLAHEVTHTVQQSQGRVGKGIDPDAGLESEARVMGTKLARVMPSAKSLVSPNAHAPGVYTQAAALQRTQDGAARSFALKPLYDLQPQAVQRLGNPFGAIGNAVQGGLSAVANAGKEMIAGALTQIPGYRELTLAFGKDLVTGKLVAQNPNTILDTLSGWVPGPLKDILKALKETNALPKAWAWFKAELARLNFAGVLSEVTSAIGKADLGAAKNAVTKRIGGLKALIVGSTKKIAEIGLSALAAGLGPVGQGVIAQLRKNGDLIIQVLKNPAKFAGNLLSALKGGFRNFASNAPKHLQSGLGQWLTGASGITFPARLDLQGVFLTALSVMGLTYQAMRGRLVKAMGPNGEKQVRAAEGTLDALKTLKGGLHKSGEMKANQAPVGTEVVAGLKSEVTKSVVMAGITKVASMLIPGGGFVQALMGAFRSVQFVVQQGQQIMGVITSAVQSAGAIAAGNIGAAVKGVESTLARSIPVALGFLGKVLGLGNIGTKIKAVIAKVRGKLENLLDKIVARIKTAISKLVKKGTGPANAKTSPAALSDNDKKAKLKAGVSAIRPQFQALVGRHASVRDLKGQLNVWQQQHGLTRVWMTKQEGPFSLRAKVNPEETVGQAMTPGDVDLRGAARRAVDQLMKSPAVQARAREIAQRAQQLLSQNDVSGSASNPFVARSGVDTLALLVYSRQTPVTPERPISGLEKRSKGQSETHFDYGDGLKAQHGQWQAGTNTFVRKVGTYDDIAAMIDKIKANTGRPDGLVATDLQNFVRTGRLNPIYNEQERQQLTAVRHLITYSESVRSPDNSAHVMMVLDRIVGGHANWKTGLQDLPMHIKNAAGAKRGLELLDQKVENVSPKAAQMLRKFMPSVTTLRQKEADLIRKWMVQMKTQHDCLFANKQEMSAFILRQLNQFYGAAL
ncbi:DUF4157 domain-containing protein [Deinococcus sp. A31D244]|uniref:eCIS core domain-containing protein n=1 Tax=Deinococcus sp. A31D244 TaxID=3397675 RepID=UPI0039DF6F08